MYSPSCNKNWAEIDGIPTYVLLKLLVWNANGNQEQVTWDDGGTYAWTDMVYGGVAAGASIDNGIDGPYYIFQYGATPPSDMGL